jgi:hypothetical protein
MDSQLRLRCDGRWIRDELGRVRIFRGANVSGRSKLPPFLPFDNPAWFDQLAGWGWNTVRLLVMWEGLEPARTAYDDEYLAKVMALATAAGMAHRVGQCQVRRASRPDAPGSSVT